jgi:osmotically inducible lipoprotein OsmB
MKKLMVLILAVSLCANACDTTAGSVITGGAIDAGTGAAIGAAAGNPGAGAAIGAGAGVLGGFLYDHYMRGR